MSYETCVRACPGGSANCGLVQRHSAQGNDKLDEDLECYACTADMTCYDLGLIYAWPDCFNCELNPFKECVNTMGGGIPGIPSFSLPKDADGFQCWSCIDRPDQCGSQWPGSTWETLCDATCTTPDKCVFVGKHPADGLDCYRCEKPPPPPKTCGDIGLRYLTQCGTCPADKPVCNPVTLPFGGILRDGENVPCYDCFAQPKTCEQQGLKTACAADETCRPAVAPNGINCCNCEKNPKTCQDWGNQPRPCQCSDDQLPIDTRRPDGKGGFLDCCFCAENKCRPDLSPIECRENCMDQGGRCEPVTRERGNPPCYRCVFPPAEKKTCFDYNMQDSCSPNPCYEGERCVLADPLAPPGSPPTATKAGFKCAFCEFGNYNPPPCDQHKMLPSCASCYQASMSCKWHEFGTDPKKYWCAECLQPPDTRCEDGLLDGACAAQKCTDGTPCTTVAGTCHLCAAVECPDGYRPGDCSGHACPDGQKCFSEKGPCFTCEPESCSQGGAVDCGSCPTECENDPAKQCRPLMYERGGKSCCLCEPKPVLECPAPQVACSSRCPEGQVLVPRASFFDVGTKPQCCECVPAEEKTEPQCQTRSDCDDGLFCNGQEDCGEDGTCFSGTSPCGPNEECNEESDTCVKKCHAEQFQYSDPDCGGSCAEWKMECSPPSGSEGCYECTCPAGLAKGNCLINPILCGFGQICRQQGAMCYTCDDIPPPPPCPEGTIDGGCDPNPCVSAPCVSTDDFPYCHTCGTIEAKDEQKCESDSQCNDGLFCNGREYCSDSGICHRGYPPCWKDHCDEEKDQCIRDCDHFEQTIGSDCLHCPADSYDCVDFNPPYYPQLQCKKCVPKTSPEECPDGSFLGPCPKSGKCADGSACSAVGNNCHMCDSQLHPTGDDCSELPGTTTDPRCAGECPTDNCQATEVWSSKGKIRCYRCEMPTQCDDGYSPGGCPGNCRSGQRCYQRPGPCHICGSTQCWRGNPYDICVENCNPQPPKRCMEVFSPFIRSGLHLPDDKDDSPYCYECVDQNACDPSKGQYFDSFCEGHCDEYDCFEIQAGPGKWCWSCYSYQDEDRGKCVSDSDCDNGKFCDGAERCDVETGSCLPGTPPCASGEECDDNIGRCIRHGKTCADYQLLADGLGCAFAGLDPVPVSPEEGLNCYDCTGCPAPTMTRSQCSVGCEFKGGRCVPSGGANDSGKPCYQCMKGVESCTDYGLACDCEVCPPDTLCLPSGKVINGFMCAACLKNYTVEIEYIVIIIETPHYRIVLDDPAGSSILKGFKPSSVMALIKADGPQAEKIVKLAQETAGKITKASLKDVAAALAQGLGKKRSFTDDCFSDFSAGEMTKRPPSGSVPGKKNENTGPASFGEDAQAELVIDGPVVACGQQGEKNVLAVFDANGSGARVIDKDQMQNNPESVLAGLAQAQEAYKKFMDLKNATPRSLLNKAVSTLTSELKAPRGPQNPAKEKSKKPAAPQINPDDPLYWSDYGQKKSKVKEAMKKITSAGLAGGGMKMLQAEDSYKEQKEKRSKVDDQWGIREIGFLPLSDPDSAWNQVFPDLLKGPNTIVAVIDSGFDFSHPDGPAYVWTNSDEIPDNGIDDDQDGLIDDAHGWNFIDQNNDLRDFRGHGTFVAGIIAAKMNNGIGIAGINPGAVIMPLKVADDEGETNSLDIFRAVNYAVDHGARVINISLGGRGVSQLEQAAINRARQAGIFVAAASGNVRENINDHGPASDDGVFAVGSLDLDGTKSTISNWGGNNGLIAPGEDIYSLRSASSYDPHKVSKDSEFYYKQSGTSFSTPMAAATASLMLAVNPQLTARQIEDILHNTAEDKYDPGWDGESGAGLLNASAAIRAAVQMKTGEMLTVKINRLAVNLDDRGRSASVDVYATVRGAFESFSVGVGKGNRSTRFETVAGPFNQEADYSWIARVDQKDLRGSDEWVVAVEAKDKNGRAVTARTLLKLEAGGRGPTGLNL